MPTRKSIPQSKGKGRKQAASSGPASRMVQAPLAQNRSSRRVTMSSQRYRESERILTVNGSPSFDVQTSIVLNPGVPSSFPWLSGHAALYERYRVHRIVYRYKNLKGASTDGNILMSFDYDTLDDAPASAVEMTQATRWIDGAPWRIFELAVPCDSVHRFTRKGPVGSADLKTYDVGKLHVAAEGCADTSAHGYLEVEYDIELFDKQPDTVSSRPNNCLSAFNLSVGATVTDGNVPFDEEIVNPLSIVNAAGSFSNFPPGWYQISSEVTMGGSSGNYSEIRLNGASMASPCPAKGGLRSQTTNCITIPAQLTETDIITVYLDTGGFGAGVELDATRILFKSL